MSKELTADQVKEKLSGFNVVTKHKGAYKAKKSYYYTNGMTPDKLAERVKEAFPDAEIINKGNHWAAFCGGAKAGSAKDSYMWVEFKLPTIVSTKPIFDAVAKMYKQIPNVTEISE